MIYDVIILLIFIVTIFLGFMRGFAGSAIHSFSWAVALGLGIYGTSRLKDVFGNLFLHDMVSGALAGKFDGSTQAVQKSTAGWPTFISDGLVSGTQQATNAFTEGLTQILVALITFLIIVIGVKIILRVVVTPILSRHRHGVLGTVDRVAGAMLGAVEGAILVLVFLSILTLIVSMGSTETATAIDNTLNQSILASTLYNNNLLLSVTKGIF